MSEKIIDFISSGCEYHGMDFKGEPYLLGKHPKKYEILKDISAMANHPSDEDKYIIIGVEEKDGRAVGFRSLTNQPDESQYQQYVSENLEPQINFEYKQFKYKDFSLAYFRIYNNAIRPYLFTKEIKHPEDSKKVLFRPGDGYVRVGTSTDKMVRENFERIYKVRYNSRDRKSDLVLNPFIATSTDDLLSKYKIPFIDISIENHSTKSISVDVELKLFLNYDLDILSRNDACSLIKQLKHEKKRENDPLTLTPMIDFDVMNPMNVIIEEFEEYVVVKSMLNNNNSILQQSRDESVFGEDIILVCKNPTKVKGEILVRSDDFTEGALVESFEIDVEPENRKTAK